METKFDWVVVGSGFKGIICSYSLLKAGFSVCLVDKSSMIGGFMAPVNFNGQLVDKGPQFLDNITESDKRLCLELAGDNLLHDIGFSYASYMNGIVTEDFAIPDWRQLPGNEHAQILLETLNMASPDHEKLGLDQSNSTLDDLLNHEGKRTKEKLTDITRKFLLKSPSQCSPEVTKMVTFLGRKLLLDNQLALLLKQVPQFDALFAALKITVDENRFNLYPKGQHMGILRDKFEQRLLDSGVQLSLNSTVTEIKPNEEYIDVILNTQNIQSKNLLFATDIETTEKICLSSNELKKHVFKLPQLFYYFKVAPTNVLQTKYYVINYDSDNPITRTTNTSLYGDVDTQDNSILCVEVPANQDSELWCNPEAGTKLIWDRLEEMKSVKNDFVDAKVFRVPETFNIPLKGFEKTLSKIFNQIKIKYGTKVYIPAPNTLTRANILKCLREDNFFDWSKTSLSYLPPSVRHR